MKISILVLFMTIASVPAVNAQYFYSIGQKNDAIQKIRNEANSAFELNSLLLNKYNTDRANFTSAESEAMSHASEVLKTAGQQIATIQSVPILVQHIPTRLDQNYVAHNDPTGIPVPQPVAQSTPTKLNGSQHPTNEHHITNAPTQIKQSVPQTINMGEHLDGQHIGPDQVTKPVLPPKVVSVGSIMTTSAPTPVTHQVNYDTQIADHESRLNSLEGHEKSQDQRIDQNDKKAMAGIAGALAQSGLHYTNTENSIAAGAGAYDGEDAVAVGYSHQWEGIRASVQSSVDSANHFGASASMAVGW